MSDTGTPEAPAAAGPDILDVDDVFKKAQARAGQIQRDIESQKRIKAEADTRIRALNEELIKVNRLVGAMTPRTRTTKPESAKTEAKKVTPASKKAVAAKP